MKRLSIAFAIALLLTSGSSAQAPAAGAADTTLFDRAEAISVERDLRRARDLYRQAAEKDPDANRRDRAAIAAAGLEWHVFQDASAARTMFARVSETSREAAAAWNERAGMEIELTRDYDAARAAASRALGLAKTINDRETALLRGARATIEQARMARLDGKCPNDRDTLLAAMSQLRQAVGAGGPILESSRLLLVAALLTGDNAAALQGWRWYYTDVPRVVPEALGGRREIGLALASARLFAEAEMVLRDPCAGETFSDADVRDVLTYAAALRRIEKLTGDHHRSIARGSEDSGAFRKALEAEGLALWNALSWPAERPSFSLAALTKELERRFGTVTSLGETNRIFSLVLGHKVIDENRIVRQYGHSAPLRFISLDGMVSSGYMAWARRNQAGTGGWIGSDAIYQIRPMYADGPIKRWRYMTDPALRARRAQEIADETRRDVERAKAAPIANFRGLDLRLRTQAAEALRAELASRGLEGNALRDAFVEQWRRNEFEASIWAHEGRHAIDKMVFKISDSPELELRAKISEVALAPAPRGSFGSLLAPIGPPSPHGIANKRLLEGVAAWMRAHANEIKGLDPAAPLIPQLDKLTDDQLRAAFLSMEPLLAAKPAA